MSAWSIVTLQMDASLLKYNDNAALAPSQFILDSGIDEQGWTDEEEQELYFAISYGRYQYRRFEEHMRDFHAPQFSGIKRAFIVDAENTGDSVTVKVYEPKQERYEEREDGYESVDSFEGQHFPRAKQVTLLDRIEDVYGIRPMLEGLDTDVPPDAVVSVKYD